MDVPIEDFTFNKGQRDRIPLSVDDVDGTPVALDPSTTLLETKNGKTITPIVSPENSSELLFVVTPEWLRSLGSKPVEYRIRIATPGDEEMFLTGTITVEGW